ncbi:MAG: Hsp20/alpha crystallin family protein [Planctomycetales bacterium]|nr:Hsp20/alpha crystallin family protein [Planctomycetales bacterium]
MSTSLLPRAGRSMLPDWNRGPLTFFREEMDDLVNRFLPHDDQANSLFPVTPSLDLSETDTEVQVRMDLPGVKPEDIDIQLNGNQLRVSGERKEEKEDKGRTYHRIERRFGAFSRSVTLPCEVEEDEVAAEFHEGALTVTLPKSEQTKSRKIPVKG